MIIDMVKSINPCTARLTLLARCLGSAATRPVGARALNPRTVPFGIRL
jgi:hypothetical protein